MTDKNKEPTPQDPFEVWQKYFEQQQKEVLQFWTQVLNNMWGTGK